MSLSTHTKDFLQPIRGYVLSERAIYAIAGLLALADASLLYVLRPPGAGQLPRLSIPGPDWLPLPWLRQHCEPCTSFSTAAPLNALGYNALTILSLPFLAYAFVAGGLRAFRAPAPAPHLYSPQTHMGLILRHNGLLGSAERSHRAPSHPRSLGPSTA